MLDGFGRLIRKQRRCPLREVAILWQAEAVDDTQLDGDLMHVLVTKEELAARISELAAEMDRDYAGKDLLLVGVLNGAVMVMPTSPARSRCTAGWTGWLRRPTAQAANPRAVRILKDLSTDVTGMDVLLVEDIIDTGLDLSYLVGKLRSRDLPA